MLKGEERTGRERGKKERRGGGKEKENEEMGRVRERGERCES